MKCRCLMFFAALVLFLSCEKGPDGAKPTFPQMMETTISGSGEYTLEFHAEMPWMLQSSAPWVRFVDNGMKVYDISGLAGDVQVQLEISENGQTFEDEKTVISLKMGQYTEGILTITRTAREHLCILKDAGQNIVESIDITFDDFTEYVIKTNFEFISELPVQVEFSSSVVGKALVERDFEARIREAHLTKPISVEDGISLKIKTVDGKLIKEYPIIYKGIDNTFIRVNSSDGSMWYENDLYQAVVYPDGVKFRGGSPAGGVYDKDGNEKAGSFYYFSDYAELQVIALNDKFHFVSFESDFKGDIVLNENPWIHATLSAEDARIVHVTAEPSTELRTACMLAVPEGLYESVLGQVEAGGNYQKVKHSLEKMILAEFIQCDPEKIELDMRDGVKNWNRLHGYKVHTKDTEEGSKLIEDANCYLNDGMPESYPRLTRAYEAWINAGTSVIIFPMYRESSLGSFTDSGAETVFRGYCIYDSNWQEDKEMMNVKTGSYAGLWDDWYMYYTNVLSLPSDRYFVYVLFRSKDGVEDKLLKLNIRK
ncbi:MAG: DUF5003 domain-containing protein [Candidatus Cryptobacteroides sp.]